MDLGLPPKTLKYTSIIIMAGYNAGYCIIALIGNVTKAVKSTLQYISISLWLGIYLHENNKYISISLWLGIDLHENNNYHTSES